MEELKRAQMDPELANADRQAALEKNIKELEDGLQERRKKSQLLSRVNIIRDKLVKNIILGLGNNQPYQTIETQTFRLWIGRTTNLSSVHPSFVFPAQYVAPWILTVYKMAK